MSDQKLKNKKYVIAIAGPTASGKTNLSLTLAHALHAEIFSADSRQIYKELNIGTAKPQESVLNQIPHHFINYISIHQPYTAGKYAQDLNTLLSRYFQQNHIAIVVGGTGLYLKSFIEGLDDLPPADQNVILELNTVYENNGLSHLQEMLYKLDPDYYKAVDLSNHRRIIRALSVSISKNKPYSSLLGNVNNMVDSEYEIIGIVLNPPRDILYQRINQRVDAMIEEGLEKEVLQLLPFKDLPALQTVGYSEFFDYFSHKISLEKAIELIKQNSRRYAKRQVTWFKKYGYGQSFIDIDENIIMSYVLNKLQ